ncbi:MAG: NAD(P)/FAD-dependent oxidoreductase [Longimicrobiales bacterium]
MAILGIWLCKIGVKRDSARAAQKEVVRRAVAVGFLRLPIVMRKAREFDVAVVGGGPAGLSSALWLGRYLLKTVLIDSGDPRNWETASVNGYLGLPRVRPAALRRRGRGECRRYGVKLINGAVDRADRTDIERFELTLQDGRRFAVRRLVLAIGLKDVWPDLPGLDRCYGQSAHHCPDCDGYDTCNRKTLVVGYGRKAVALAFALATWTRDLIVCTNGHPCDIPRELVHKLDALNIPIVETRVRWVHSEGSRLRWLELADGMHLDAEKLFFTVSHYPADDLGVQLGCERDEDGLILVDHAKRTSVENVWAVGDITPGPQLAISAAADGAVAAAAVQRSLLPETVRL